MKTIFLFFVGLLGCASVVFASIPGVSSWNWNTNSGSVDNPQPDASAACIHRGSDHRFTGADGGNFQGVAQWYGCTPYGTAVWVAQGTAALACPQYSTASGGSCVCTPPKVEDSTHTSCVDPNACIAKIGNVVTKNVTAGYANKGFTQAIYPSYLPNGQPAPGGYVGLPPSSMCVDGCIATRGNTVASWSSMEPTATGFYRISDDWEFTVTSPGTSCTVSSDENALLSPTFAVPPCDGFVGSVGGKITCIPKVADTSSRGVSDKQSTVGNPTAGTAGGAGNIPSSGGNGGNAGGPKGSSDGSLMTPGGVVAPAPTGTASAVPPSTPASGVEASCGAPGEPKCFIDETGTPNAADPGIVKAADKYKTDVDAMRATVTGTADKGFFSGWGTMFSAPAVVACTPVLLPAFQGGASLGSIDPCPVVDGVRSVMGYIWSLTAMVMCLGMIRRVV